MTQGVMRKETIDFGAGPKVVYTYSMHKNMFRPVPRLLGNPKDFLCATSRIQTNVGRPEAGSDKTASQWAFWRSYKNLT